VQRSSAGQRREWIFAQEQSLVFSEHELELFIQILQNYNKRDPMNFAQLKAGVREANS
jgi:hypothetical protein